MAAVYLIHTYHTPDAKPSEDMLTLQLDDHWFRIPPDEPFEVDKDSNGRQLDNPEFYAHHIMAQHGSIYGIVPVPATKTRTGIVLDVDTALEQASAALLMNRHRHINNWAQEQLQSRVKLNLPVLPPTGFVEESIKELGVDLQASYNFKPVGWNFKPKVAAHVQGQELATASIATVDHSDDIATLQEDNAELRDRLTRMEAMWEKALAPRGKGKPKEPAADVEDEAPEPK